MISGADGADVIWVERFKRAMVAEYEKKTFMDLFSMGSESSGPAADGIEMVGTGSQKAKTALDACDWQDDNAIKAVISDKKILKTLEEKVEESLSTRDVDRVEKLKTMLTCCVRVCVGDKRKNAEALLEKLDNPAPSAAP